MGENHAVTACAVLPALSPILTYCNLTHMNSTAVAREEEMGGHHPRMH